MKIETKLRVIKFLRFFPYMIGFLQFCWIVGGGYLVYDNSKNENQFIYYLGTYIAIVSLLACLFGMVDEFLDIKEKKYVDIIERRGLGLPNLVRIIS